MIIYICIISFFVRLFLNKFKEDVFAQIKVHLAHRPEVNIAPNWQN